MKDQKVVIKTNFAERMSTKSCHALENQVKAKWTLEPYKGVFAVSTLILLISLVPSYFVCVVFPKDKCRGSTVSGWIHLLANRDLGLFLISTFRFGLNFIAARVN